MKLVTLTRTALFATLLACAACGSAEEGADEAIGDAPVAAKAEPRGYGYEMVPDPSTAAADPNPAATVDGIPAGRLTPQVIQSTVRGRFTEMRACYEAALQQAPALSGRVEARFNILQDGSVTQVRSGDSTLSDAAMVQCVLDVFAGTTFPTSEGGAVEVVYPVMFTPGE